MLNSRLVESRRNKLQKTIIIIISFSRFPSFLSVLFPPFITSPPTVPPNAKTHTPKTRYRPHTNPQTPHNTLSRLISSSELSSVSEAYLRNDYRRRDDRGRESSLKGGQKAREKSGSRRRRAKWGVAERAPLSWSGRTGYPG